MDPVTQVALVGVAGTVLGALVGAGGAVRAAGVSTRGQSTLEDHKSRRTAYSACTTALLVRRDTVTALMDGMRSGELDLESAKAKLQQAQTMRADVMKTLGAVLVEGPEWPARSAETAARHLDVWLEGLAYWVSEGLPEDMHERDQWTPRQEERLLTEEALDRFAAACRRVLHPKDPRPVRRFLRRRW
ncbi:hypothetical protein [Streptomyces lydicus]|uniref:hypothetical protein n=1 Tax=Streptomyces lydicus TaxID=47763 RepID=UPI000981F4C4|nr:hypothetical protein [Streptomyces lydicus]